MLNIIAFAVIGLVLVAGGVVMWRQHRSGLVVQSQVATMEKKISDAVEERLVSHTKYCERVDGLVRKQLEAEEEKWRELIQAATCRVDEFIVQARKECELATKNFKNVLTEANRAALAKSQTDMAQVENALEKQKMQFKSLLDQAYLEQYEKMRRNPPRPKKGPRKKVDPPQRFRSLDDEFNFCPQEDPE